MPPRVDPAAALREATERNAREARAERDRATADAAAQAEAEAAKKAEVDAARVRERGKGPQQPAGHVVRPASGS